MTPLDAKTGKQLIESVARAVIDHADELTELDSAIGDGDHGHNMKRGMEAVLAESAGIASKPAPDALQAIGMQLVMKVGGASGPLYGTLAMAFGKAFPDDPSRDGVVAAFGEAIAAVQARGRSEPGQKTMLDVLVPVHTALTEGAALGAVAKIAADAREATKPLRAQRGRASFLGDRSIGHIDPGARSSELIVAAIVEFLGQSE